MKVSEIFESIQGEGINVGKPSVFLRTALCNLACTWCDTKYTWDWKNFDYEKEVKEMETEQVREKIIQYDSKNLVITGGEPMMQQKELESLLEVLKSDNYFVEIETNGTIEPSTKMQEYVNQWNVSPKLANSGNDVKSRENEKCYELFAALPNAFFKYVVANKKDVAETELLVEKYQILKDHVLLMPESQTKSQLYQRQPIIKQLSKSSNFGYSTRMHILLWGDQRGK